MVERENEIERIVRLETTVEQDSCEIESLRESRHEHGNVLQRHELQIHQLEREVEEVSATTTEQGKVMIEANLPEVRKTLGEHTKLLAAMNAEGQVSKNRFDTMRAVLLFIGSTIVSIVVGIAVGWGVISFQQAPRSEPGKKGGRNGSAVRSVSVASDVSLLRERQGVRAVHGLSREDNRWEAPSRCREGRGPARGSNDREGHHGLPVPVLGPDNSAREGESLLRRRPVRRREPVRRRPVRRGPWART